jgi:hypothetical protein
MKDDRRLTWVKLWNGEHFEHLRKTTERPRALDNEMLLRYGARRYDTRVIGDPRDPAALEEVALYARREDAAA